METVLSVGLGNAAAAGLLALGAATIGVFPFARNRPALRHGLWLLVLLKLVTPPLWSVPVARSAGPGEERAAPVLDRPVVEPGLLLIDPPEARAESAIVDDATIAVALVEPPPAPEPAIPPWGWPGSLLAAWGAGSLLTFGVASGRIRRFRRLLNLAEPAPGPLRDRVEALARRLGLKSAPEVRQVPGAVSPLIWALGCRPRLIVPTGLWDRLDDRQRDTLLAHELAHLKRRDHWVRCLELLVTGLYWWLPLVWIARRGVREAEEQCCDAWVVWAFPDAARTYAEALLETLDFLSGAGPDVAVAACGLGPVHHLKRRMTMILQGTTPRNLTWSGLLTVLGLSATLLPIAPTWAQRPEAEREGPPAFAPERPEARDRDRDPGPRRERDGDRDRDRPEARDPGPRREREGDRERDHPEARDPGPRRDREREGDRERESPEAQLRKPEIRIFKQRKPEDVEKSPKRDSPEAAKGEGDERRFEYKVYKVEKDLKRDSPEAVKGDREGDERGAEIKRLMAEVAMHRKALREAEMRLDRAMRQLGDEKKREVEVIQQDGRKEVRVFEMGRDQVIMDKTGRDQVIMKKMPGRPSFHATIPLTDPEKRFAELEKRLERLQDEVKSLRKDAPERR